MRFSDDLFLICGLAEPLSLLLGLVFWFCWRLLTVGWLAAAPLLRRLTLRLVSLSDRRLRLRDSLLLVVLPSRKRTWNSRKFKVKTAYRSKRTSLKPQSNRDTTFQSMINAKLSKQRFWHCHENGLIKTIQTIPHNLYVSVKSSSLYWGLG